MSVKSFKNLKVWQKARRLSVLCYNITSKFPKSEQFGITNQIRRSSVSIASNIAEGHERNTTKEFLQFIHIALGSLAELETQLLISSDLDFLKLDNKIFENISELSKMLNALRKSLIQKMENNLITLAPGPKPLTSSKL